MSNIPASPTTLWTVLGTAKGGDVISLVPGNYGDVGLNNFKFAPPGVTIKPQSSGVVFTQLSIGGSQNLTVSGIEIFRQIQQWDGCCYLSNCYQVVLDHCNIHAKVNADGTFINLGVMVRSCDRCQVTNTEIHDIGSAYGFYQTTNSTISGCTIHDFETDGILCSGSGGCLIDANHLYNSFPQTGDHPDFIQFFTVGGTTTATGNNKVTNNVMYRGKGGKCQGIFVEDEHDMTIMHNAMVGTMYNGISIARGNNITISSNFVQGETDMGTDIIVRGASTNVVCTNNTVSQPIANYAADGVNPGFVETGTKTIAAAPVGSTADLDAWVKGASPLPPPPPAPPPVVTPPAPPPPVVTPPAPPVDSPQVANLKAQVLSLQTQVASLQAQLTTANSKYQALHAAIIQINTAVAQLNTAIANAMKL